MESQQRLEEERRETGGAGGGWSSYPGSRKKEGDGVKDKREEREVKARRLVRRPWPRGPRGAEEQGAPCSSLPRRDSGCCWLMTLYGHKMQSHQLHWVKIQSSHAKRVRLLAAVIAAATTQRLVGAVVCVVFDVSLFHRKRKSGWENNIQTHATWRIIEFRFFLFLLCKKRNKALSSRALISILSSVKVTSNPNFTRLF